MHASGDATPRISPVTTAPPTGAEARAVCPHCGGHLDTTTVIGRQDTVETVGEPGPRIAGEAAVLRATLGCSCGSSDMSTSGMEQDRPLSGGP